mmetsp:Transcript_3944/g.12350  ORF Transcript_3944/g.12350 Transcript_3944/m.12350 type:complete len:256 (-) Transcript_3944:380-1147(-)
MGGFPGVVGSLETGHAKMEWCMRCVGGSSSSTGSSPPDRHTSTNLGPRREESLTSRGSTASPAATQELRADPHGRPSAASASHVSTSQASSARLGSSSHSYREPRSAGANASDPISDRTAAIPCAHSPAAAPRSTVADSSILPRGERQPSPRASGSNRSRASARAASVSPFSRCDAKASRASRNGSRDPRASSRSRWSAAHASAGERSRARKAERAACSASSGARSCSVGAAIASAASRSRASATSNRPAQSMCT